MPTGRAPSRIRGSSTRGVVVDRDRHPCSCTKAATGKSPPSNTRILSRRKPPGTLRERPTRGGQTLETQPRHRALHDEDGAVFPFRWAAGRFPVTSSRRLSRLRRPRWHREEPGGDCVSAPAWSTTEKYVGPYVLVPTKPARPAPRIAQDSREGRHEADLEGATGGPREPTWIEILPLDPRDPDVVRAKGLARRKETSQ